MAMYPNATRGYMPFVKPAHKRQAAKKSRMDKADSLKARSSDMKTYKVTLRDRNGFTYTYIIQADTSSKTTPILCESRVAAPKSLSSSLPDIKAPAAESSEARRHSSCLGLAQGMEDLSKVDDGEKKGLFNSIINFIRKKTTTKSSKTKQQLAAKSKRKTKPMFPKKRQRTISTMSNLDPIQESPEEDEDDDFDTDSYSHDSVSSDGSSSES